MNIGGVYEILNTATGKRYIGSTQCFSRRWKDHLCLLRRSAHHSPRLQNAWDKYGESAFLIRPLMICLPDAATQWEQRYLDEFRPEYNIAVTAGAPMRGRKLSAAARARVSAAMRGRPVSQETRARISASNTGKPRTDAFRAHMSAVHMGRPGRPLSAAGRAKLSAARLARPLTPEQHAHLVELSAAARRGKALSPEHRAKVSAGLCAFHARAVV